MIVGSTAIIPNIEHHARGLMNAADILSSSPQIIGALVASEDMAVSLNAPRQQDSQVLNHVRILIQNRNGLKWLLFCWHYCN